MRRLLVIGLILLLAGHVAWRTFLTRSSTIRLEHGGYELTYTMAWGFGMSQRFSLSRLRGFWPGPTSDWMELWKRPYNSGLSIYYARREGVYYIGSIYKLFRFNPNSGALTASCNSADVPTYADLHGSSLNITSPQELLSKHPGARNFQTFIGDDQQGEHPASSTASVYYPDLDYIGRFGLLRGRGFRGGDAAFSPAGKAVEPAFSLTVHCG